MPGARDNEMVARKFSFFSWVYFPLLSTFTVYGFYLWHTGLEALEIVGGGGGGEAAHIHKFHSRMDF